MILSLRAKIEELGHNVDLFSDETISVFRVELARIASAAHAEWVRLAQTRLKSSRDLYVNGLRQMDSFLERSVGGESVYDITLIGTMPNNIEHGMAAFDMKGVRPGWLGGSKAKVSKDGKRYVVIPFRHSTSSQGRFSYTGKAKVDQLDRHLKKVVRDYGLNRMVRAAGGNVVAGPVRRAPAHSSIHPYLRNLTRVQKPVAGRTSSGKGRGQSMLMTWRVMSENSAPSSWIHPGIEAKNLLDEVKRFVDRQMENSVNKILGT